MVMYYYLLNSLYYEQKHVGQLFGLLPSPPQYNIQIMQQHLIRKENLQGEEGSSQQSYGSFREFRKEAGSFGIYQKRLFLLMGFYWITASFFLILPFYFYKRPLFCANRFPNPSSCQQCLEQCVKNLCLNEQINIKDFIIYEKTLTYSFGLFCGQEPWRVFYKICPESLSWIGLLIYGAVADRKGRKVAFKISWRFYTIGLLLYTATETQFLISLGYFIACVNCFPSLVIQFVLLFQQIDRSIRLKACYLLLSFLLIAPLIASFLAGFLVEIGLKTTLTVLCTAPALILSFITNFLKQSAIFSYKKNKLLAYNIINNIAKINKLPPITIDLSKSTWLKYDHYEITIWDVLHHGKLRSKLLVSCFFMFTVFFNNRLAQISLDEFTNQYLRGTIMNSTSAVATITVIVLITKYKINKYTYFGLFLLVASSADLIISALGIDQFWIDSLLSILIRYTSDLCYSLFLIYVIETFPTVCRTQCLAVVLCGSSFGVILAYSLKEFKLLELGMSVLLNLLLVKQSRHMQLDYENKLMDTLTDQHYDQNDRFKRI